MTYYWKRNMLAMSLLLLLFAVHLTAADDDATPANSEDDDDSSSEETVEDSNESRRKRSLEVPATENYGKGGEEAKPIVRAALPGLPDPATVLKIAEILQTVGEKIIPILVQGNSAADLVGQRVNQDFAFVKNFRKEIEMLMEEFTMK